MKKVKQSFSILLFLLLLVPSLSQAQPVPPGNMPPKEFTNNPPMEDPIDQIGLTYEQKQKLKEHKNKSDLVAMETKSKIDVLKLKLQYELDKKEMDKAAIDKIIEETNQQNEILLKNHVNSIVALREILTYEQFEKLQKIHQESDRRGPNPEIFQQQRSFGRPDLPNNR